MSTIVTYAAIAFGLVALLFAARAQREVVRERSNAMLDSLTGLLNRRGWNELVLREMTRAVREAVTLTIFYMDIDDFKRVNDSHGHTAGDELLCAVSAAIRSATRGHDIIARLGGDEFAVLAGHDGSASVPNLLLDRWTSAFETLGVSVSIGVASLDAAGDAQTALQRADDHMYARKQLRHTAIVTRETSSSVSASHDFTLNRLRPGPHRIEQP